MPDTLNQLVGSHRWISATWTLLSDTLGIAHLQLSSDGMPIEKRPMCLPTLKENPKITKNCLSIEKRPLCLPIEKRPMCLPNKKRPMCLPIEKRPMCLPIEKRPMCL